MKKADEKNSQATPDSNAGVHSRTRFKNPRRYRLDFIAENTFNRVWSVSFSRMRVIIVSVTIVAAIAALMFVILFFSPVSKLLPGRLEGNLRSQYIEMALRVDSLDERSRVNDAYIRNLRNILSAEQPQSDVKPAVDAAQTKIVSDTLMSASEAEQNFVRNYEEAERFNLSVLTPIAAEGMAFYSPVSGTVNEPSVSESGRKVEFSETGLVAVSSVYRGTVIDKYAGAGGLTTIVIQHPNDFVSKYEGLSEQFVGIGDKVSAGQRIGHSGNGLVFGFRLWHNGSATNPTDYIGF